MRVYIGNIIHSKTPEKLEILVSHCIGVNADGDIAFVKPASEYTREKADVIEELDPRQFLFPGFIDTHAHAPQYPNCGIFGDSTLLDWLETYTFPLESKYKNLDLAEEVYTRLVERQLSNGTTLCSYFGSVHVPSTAKLAELCLQKGQRANVGRVCMQRFCPEELQKFALEDDIEFIKQVRKLDPSGSMVKPVITPRFAPSCEGDVLTKLGQLAHDENLPVQTHVSENAAEIAWVKELFPESVNYVDVYEKTKLLKQDTVLAHAIHLTNEEIETIKKHNSGVSHCPNSNASLASGIARVKEYIDKGMKVSLGTDVSGGSTPSILKNARLALLMSRMLAQFEDNKERLLSPDNILFVATLGGAQVLDVDHTLGNFEVGKKFDAQLIDILAQDSPIDVFGVTLPQDEEAKLSNFVQKWVYIGDDRNTLKVWVNGKLVHSRV